MERLRKEGDKMVESKDAKPSVATLVADAFLGPLFNAGHDAEQMLESQRVSNPRAVQDYDAQKLRRQTGTETINKEYPGQKSL